MERMNGNHDTSYPVQPELLVHLIQFNNHMRYSSLQEVHKNLLHEYFCILLGKKTLPSNTLLNKFVVIDLPVNRVKSTFRVNRVKKYCT